VIRCCQYLHLVRWGQLVLVVHLVLVVLKDQEIQLVPVVHSGQLFPWDHFDLLVRVVLKVLMDQLVQQDLPVRILQELQFHQMDQADQ